MEEIVDVGEVVVVVLLNFPAIHLIRGEGQQKDADYMFKQNLHCHGQG